MSKKEDELFKAWGEELAKEVDASEKEALQAWLALPVAREVYRGTVGQAELYRRMNQLDQDKKELAQARKELEDWFEEEAPKNAALIAERDALRNELAKGSGNPPPAEGTGIQLSAEDLASIKSQAAKAEVLDRLLPAVLGDMSTVLKDSIKNNFDIDPREVIQLSLQQGIEPWRAYQNLTAEERQKRAESDHETERKKWFEEGRRSAMTNSPDHLQPSGPSVVDYIQSLNKAVDQGGRAPMERADRVGAALKELMDGNLTD
jgi:hypothetical protein